MSLPCAAVADPGGGVCGCSVQMDDSFLEPQENFLTARVVFENCTVTLDKHLYVAKRRKSLILHSHPLFSVSLSPAWASTR